MSKLPILPARTVIRKLLRAGFVVLYQRGSHAKLRNHEKGGTVTVPMHPGDIGRKTIASIIKQSGFTVQEFLDL